MSSFVDVQTRITGDFLNRPTLVDETKRAIKAAIRHYEYERWGFNETATSIATVSSQSYALFPSNLLILDDLRLTINGEDLELIRESPGWVREMNTARTFGPPIKMAIYQERAEFFPIPDSAWALPVYYLKSLTELSADADTNAWIQGAWQDVIAYHAAKLVWATVLRNDQEAVKYGALERTAYSTVLEHRDQKKVFRLRATQF
jgi:hypothetical protein